MQIIVVSDPTVATEVLQMPRVLDKNLQALSTLDSVSFHCEQNKSKCLSMYMKQV